MEPALRSELAGVVQYIDQHLLDLAGFEIQGLFAGLRSAVMAIGLIVGKRRNFVQRLFQAFPHIARLQVQAALDVAPTLN